MNGDTGPRPGPSSTWIFTFGQPRKRLMRHLLTAVRSDYLDWFLFVIPSKEA